MFEAMINLKTLVLEKGGKNFDNYKVLNEGKNNISQIDSRMLEYLRDREELERLASEYFIKECKCDPKYLDKKGNTIINYLQFFIIILQIAKEVENLIEFLLVGWALVLKQ